MAIWNRLQGVLAGLALGRAASASAEGVFEVTKQNAWARRPFRTLTAREAAQAEVAHIGEAQSFTSLAAFGEAEQTSTAGQLGVDFDDDAKREGVGPQRYAVYRRLAQQMPQLQTTLELLNRKLIDSDTADTIFRRIGYPDGLRPALRHLRFFRPPATDLIRFAVREVYNKAQRDFLTLDAEFPEAVVPDGAQVGLTRDTLLDYWAAHWDLPSYSQLTQMLFRKELTPAEFRAALKAIDIAPVWREKMEAIARAIPTMTDMSRLAVREVYDPAKRKALDLDAEFPEAYATEVAKHGMARADAKDLWAGHWRLPSLTQGFTMFHRDKLTRAELSSLIKSLDYAPIWREKLEAISFHLPSVRDLRYMLRYKIKTRAEVVQGYKQLGYSDDDAEEMTRLAEAMIPQVEATSEDTHVGKARSQLWATAHRTFLASDISDDDAVGVLERLGVPADETQDVLTFWRVERDLTRKMLTPAQLKKAWQKVVTNPATGVPWTREEVIAELVGRGFSPGDASTFLDLPGASKA